MDAPTAEFVIYIINEISNRFGKPTSEIYKTLKKTGCIDKYLVPCYDVLHTMGSEAVADDVVRYVKTGGESL